MSNSPVLGLTLMSASQAQKEVVFNNFLIAMDALFKGSVLSAALTAPPSSPNEGDAYIVAAGGTGAWSGQDQSIAFYFNGWQFVAPPLKITLYDVASSTFVQYQGSPTFWVAIPATSIAVLNDISNVQGTPTDGQVLTYVLADGKWEPKTPSFTGALSALSDVSVTEGSAINGNALLWNETAAKWEPGVVLTAKPAFLSLPDVSATGAANGWIPVYNSTGPGVKFVNPSTLTTVGALSNVGDVTYTGLETGDVLQWNGAAWAPATSVSGLLSVLTDVDITEGAGINGYSLVYNATAGKWVAASVGAVALSALSDVNVTESATIDGYALTWNNSTSKWIASPVSGGGSGVTATNPSVVQSKVVAGSSIDSVTMTTAPANGNLLIAFVGSTSALTANTGWVQLDYNTAGMDWGGIYYKVAGASESTTQQPITSGGSPSEIAIYEVENAQVAFLGVSDLSAVPNDQTSTTTPTTVSLYANAGALFLYAFLGSATGTPTVSFGTLDDTETGSGRIIAAGHGTTTASETKCTATFTGAGTTKAMSVMLVPQYVSVGGTLAGDTDVSIASPSNNQSLLYNSSASKWENVGTPFNIGVSITGLMANGEILLQYVLPCAVTIPPGAAGSYAKANTAATGSTTATIKQNGTTVGTIVWSASGTAGVITISTAISLAAGDILQLTAQTTADATLADIGITLAGVRS